MASTDSTRPRLPRDFDLRALAARLTALAARVPLALAILLMVGVALRVFMWLEYRPAMMNNPDTAAYVAIASDDLFETDAARPAGYPMFLRFLHAVAANVDLVIVLQALLGIATALLLYATVRRAGAPVWAGIVAAAAVLLSLDQIQFEHTIQAEGPFTFALALVLYGAVRSLDDPRRVLGRVTSRHLWIVLCGVVLGLGAWIRAIGVPMIPFLALWFALAIPGSWRLRIGRGALAAAVAGSIVLVYFFLHSAATGSFGLTDSAGWAFYARTAPIADCSQFEPPAGTEKLCEDSPPQARPGPDYYAWAPKSPAFRMFGGPPVANDKLGAFARQVIIHQPRYYLWVSFRDFSRYFVPGINDEQNYIVDYPYLDIDRRDRPVEGDVERITAGYYPGTTVHIGDGLTVLTDLQQFLRVPPFLMLQALILGGVGIWLARGRTRAALILLLGTAVLGLAIPSATVSYNARYATPLTGPLLAAGAIGLWVIVMRLIERRQRPQPSDRSQTAPVARS
jgi:4-amino-4-deoxy-L-arabinose transferase-like glycosyltransferase